ncbi:glycoside hydrolase family 97 protein [Roseibacillus ishigakijimensis]|uniref:glycoside hydrolase family 97 protein n=1 Tax=Roseibacillus ishigakijimensis TaxID=454146 RepID=UPI0036421E4F
MAQGAPDPQIQSPDGRLSLSWALHEGVLSYEVNRDGKALIKPSATGLRWSQETTRWTGLAAEISSGQERWQPVWGKQAEVLNHYQQAVVTLEAEDPASPGLAVVFRVTDEGFAFRYQISPGEHASPLEVREDLSEFNFAQDGTAWSYNGERANKGPETLSSITETRRLPLTVRFEDGAHASLSEAAIDDFSWIDLKPIGADLGFQAALESSRIELPFATPWRAVVVGDEPGDLVDAHLLENLNPPCAIENPEWIQPGLTFWDWRTWGYEAPDGFEYGLDMASWRRFIDFASEHEVPYLLLDANWYGPEFDPTMNPTVSRDHMLEQLPDGKIVRKAAPADWEDPIDVPALITYAKEKGVGIFLYINDKARINFDFEETLATYQKWGAVGIKYGFMGARNRQQKVNKTNEIIRLCAKYKLMCNFHDGPVAPSGDYRTWPNCTTREYCHAQADAKRSFQPTTFNTSVFVNMIGGPIDMNNGMFSLEGVEVNRPRVFEAIPSTIVAECARTLLTFSGQAIVLDAPESFGAHPELFDFMAAQKQPWQESKTLAGQIGEYLMMRRTAADGTILLGATTNEEARELPVALDFLGNQQMKATIMQDAATTSYQENREQYKVETRTVSGKDTLTLRLAPGGGACVKLEPIEPPTATAQQ